MRWESLVSIQNLKLAWRRINTGRNFQHKRFFRDLYLVYETALDHNLKTLREKLLNHAWTPSHPHRLYIPKPSGLQRPISLLGIEDQILLQAVANIFAKKLSAPRGKVELKTVFSNILSAPSDSIFFTQPWQDSYNAFQKRCRTLHAGGNHWIAHFDLAAYYDTISHDMLLRIVSPQRRHTDTWDRVKSWFATWSASEPDSVTSHGIPQGPLASDFLAEAFFIPIDLELAKRNITYVRYVDDIRLFGRSENEARKAGIDLEQLCRDRGLIPQGKKYAISYAKTPEEALGSLPSIPPAEEGVETPDMEASDAVSLLDSCLGGRPLRVVDKSRFRYVMYRAPQSASVLDKIMLLLPRHPEHIDAFTAHFGVYNKSKKIVRGITALLESGIPYAYVRGELWHVLARLGTPEQLGPVLDLARTDAQNRRSCLGMSWGVMNFLMRCQEEQLCRIGTRLNAELPLSRALLAGRIPLVEFEPNRVVGKMLRGTLEEQLAAARQLQVRNISLNKLNLRQRDLPAECQHTLRSLGVIRRVSQATRDWVAERLAQRYGGTPTSIWRPLLGVDYEHALQILIEADAMYNLAPSNWLPLQDSFNDAAIRKLVNYLKVRNLPGGSQKTVGRDGKLVKYGTILQASGPLATPYPVMCASLLKVHERRNKLPGSHPYDQKGGSKNKWLYRPERDKLLRDLQQGLSEMVHIVSSNP